MISAGQASAWPKFAHILGHDEWIDIPEFQRVEDRVKNRVLLAPMIAEETSKFEKNVLLERLAEDQNGGGAGHDSGRCGQ